jgi:phosphoribosylformimino-5-aminoimidazole carboxamide ribotide isomerase
VEIYPAIDLRGGRCVRLYQGDYGRETVYGDDPVAQARAFVAEGARWIHVVDLDAARSGEPLNRPVVEAIAGAVPARIQTGGGVRDVAAGTALASAGVARVVVGTAAVEHPEIVAALAEVVPVAVGLDVRGREVAVRGWEQGTGVDVRDLLGELAGAGAAAAIVTQIEVDGTGAGPDLGTYRELLEVGELPLVASGGVGSLDDVRALAALEAGGRRLDGVIVGRALYEGAFSLPEALSAAG